MPSRPGHVTLVECGPCNSRPFATPLTIEARAGLVERLVQAGLRDLVIAGAEDLTPRTGVPEPDPVLESLPRHPDVRYSLRVDGVEVLEEVIAAGAGEIAVRAAGTHGTARRHHGGDIEAGLRRLEPVAKLAADHGVRLRGEVDAVVTCREEGPVAPAAVADLCSELLNLGCFEVSLGDQTASGELDAWRAMWESCAARVSPDRLAVRLRSDAAVSFPCLDALMPLGLQTVDTAVGGLGPDRLLGTEDVAAHLAARGIGSGLNLDLLVETAWWFGGYLSQPPSSRLARNHEPPSPG